MYIVLTRQMSRESFHERSVQATREKEQSYASRQTIRESARRRRSRQSQYYTASLDGHATAAAGKGHSIDEHIL